MPISLTITANPAQIAQAEALLKDIEGAADKALRAAVSQTSRDFRSALTDDLAKEILAKRGEILSRVTSKNTSSQGEYGGVISVSRGRLPIQDFKTTRVGKRAGVRVQMRQSGPVETFKHAFRARMQSGHVGIFGRKFPAAKVAPRSGSYAGRTIKRGPRKGQLLTRTPIKELFGLPVIDVFDKSPGFLDAAAEKLQQKFDDILQQKIQWQLDLAMK